MSSTLFLNPTAHYEAVGLFADAHICHGPADAPVPEKATVYYDGSAPWTWMQFAAEYPKEAAECRPHEYADDPPACEGDIFAYCAAFPLTADAISP